MSAARAVRPNMRVTIFLGFMDMCFDKYSYFCIYINIIAWQERISPI